ncbi:hypothetical protein AN901_200798 [Pseudomonas syringae pv. theae]|nr:hypothetical protein AN901_200798 [Pseudomonas syringae pv. theae]
MAAPFVGLYDDIGTSVDRIKTFRLIVQNRLEVFRTVDWARDARTHPQPHT